MSQAKLSDSPVGPGPVASFGDSPVATYIGESRQSQANRRFLVFRNVCGSIVDCSSCSVKPKTAINILCNVSLSPWF